MTGNTDEIFANKALSGRSLTCRLQDYRQKHAGKPKAKRKNEIISQFIHDAQLLNIWPREGSLCMDLISLGCSADRFIPDWQMD